MTTCPNCGLAHECPDFFNRPPDCVEALKAALRRRELVTANLYEALKEARQLIRMRIQYAGIRPNTPLLAQIDAAMEAAEEELCPRITTRG